MSGDETVVDVIAVVDPQLQTVAVREAGADAGLSPPSDAVLAAGEHLDGIREDFDTESAADGDVVGQIVVPSEGKPRVLSDTVAEVDADA